jgi:hypothetical protein
MKEKRGYPSKKDDGNPFAGYLYEDEKMLWMDGSLRATVPNDRKTFAYIWVTALILWFIVVAQYGGVSVAMSTSCACAFLIGMVYLLATFWPIPSKPIQVSNKGVYALTNRHLFYWNGEQVTELALEDAPEMLILPGAGSKGTLTFGNVFPAMTNIDDAAYVKTMIEQARKHRLEEES